MIGGTIPRKMDFAGTDIPIDAGFIQRLALPRKLVSTIVVDDSSSAELTLQQNSTIGRKLSKVWLQAEANHEIGVWVGRIDGLHAALELTEGGVCIPELCDKTHGSLPLINSQKQSSRMGYISTRAIIENGHLVLFLVVNPSNIVLVGKFSCWAEIEVVELATKSPNDAAILSGNLVNAIRNPC